MHVLMDMQISGYSVLAQQMAGSASASSKGTRAFQLRGCLDQEAYQTWITGRIIHARLRRRRGIPAAIRAHRHLPQMLTIMATIAHPGVEVEVVVALGAGAGALVAAVIVVEKLSKTINEDHLYEIFGQYGTIRDLDLPMSRQFGTNRGTAYILYVNEADAEAAIASMHEANLDGSIINTPESLDPAFEVVLAVVQAEEEEEEEEEWVAEVAEEALVSEEALEGIVHLSVPDDQLVITLILIDQGPTLDLDPPLHAATVVAQSPTILGPGHLQDVEVVDEGAVTTTTMIIVADVVVQVMIVIAAVVAHAHQKGLTDN
ncbi:hypothetical protein RRF57_012619 [Xylaria bambusicola]|uniref:RRM domain-containing protein n=1 Tax=Xylaria bambusicola TaxID=326684 RepID=A0AAN7ZAU8_9PEZI